MEFCPRCRGGEINAPNCPGCGGSGLISDSPTPPSPAKVLTVSPEARRLQIEAARKAREAEKHRKVRTGSRKPSGAEVALSALTPQERRDRIKWLNKYQKRQEKRLAEEKRRRRMTPEQLEREEQAKRERAYLRKLNRLKVAEQGQAPKRNPTQQKHTKPGPAPRPSRKDLSAEAAKNDQLRSQLAALLPSAQPSSGGSVATKPQRQGKQSRKLRGASHEPALRDLRPNDPLREHREEFQSAPPGFGSDEDASRGMGHSFRDGGMFGSMPSYDDHE